MTDRYDQINATIEEMERLRARVAKLEAALREARGWVIHFDNADGYQQHATLARIDAALKQETA